MIGPFFYKAFIDSLSLGVSEGLVKILIFILANSLLGWAFWRVAGFSASYVEPKIMSEIYNESFDYIHRHSYNFFNNNFSGALVKKINRVAAAFEDIVDNLIFSFLPLTIRIVFATSVMFYLSIWLGLISLVWIILFLTFNYYFSVYKLKKYDLQKVEADTKITAGLADTIINNVNVKLFSSHDYEQQILKN
jgi:ATP-binding cassette subfamily B protein